MSSSKNKDKDPAEEKTMAALNEIKAKYLPEFEKLLTGLMQMYLIRVNGEDIVLFGPLLGWPEEKDIEVESIEFGDLVRVTDVIEMLQRMRGVGEGGSVMSKLQ